MPCEVNSDLEEVILKLKAANPVLRIELDYVNEYTLLVAILLSAQTTDKMVNRATGMLFNKCITPSDMLQLGIEELKKYIKILNYYNTKAKNIIALSQILVDRFNSQVPENFEDLISLPGVGRKTANVYLANAKGMPVIGVDTHVLRVAKRLGIANENDPLKVVDQKLHNIIPTKYLNIINHLFVLHGRYVCRAIKPQCGDCVVKEECRYFKGKMKELI